MVGDGDGDDDDDNDAANPEHVSDSSGPVSASLKTDALSLALSGGVASARRYRS